MKAKNSRVSISCIFLMTFIFALGAGATTTYAETYQYIIETGDYEIVDAGDGYQEIRMEGFGQLLEPGKPKLPSRIFAIAIPPGATADLIEVVGNGMTELPGAHNITPAPMVSPLDATQEELSEIKAEYDKIVKQAYASDAAYPGTEGEFITQGAYRKYNLVQVRYSPFYYQAKSGKLFYYSSATVTVNYSSESPISYKEEPDSQPTGLMEDWLPEAEKYASELLENYDEAKGWFPSPKSDSAIGLYEFVIVTTDALVDAVQPLVNWEKCKGRTVYVATTSWINANYIGADLQRRIRYFLRDKYPSGEWGILMVCIVGDNDAIPMRHCSPNGENTATYPTDLYYAELTSMDSWSWDYDWDGYFGEQDDDTIDFIREVDVGRIPWSDAATVESICLKMAEYEYSNDMTFKSSILMPAAFFWADTDNAELMRYILSDSHMSGWNDYTLYEHNATYWSSYSSDAELIHTNVVNEWTSSDHYGFVNWAGHGNFYGAYYADGSFINSGDCSSLNDNYPAIIFSDACSTSYPENESLGRKMIKQGAVAFVGATRIAYGAHGWNDPSDGSSQSLDYWFTHHVTTRYNSVGWAFHSLALRKMYTDYGWNNSWMQMFEWNLYSNPDLWMRDRPSALPNLDYQYRTGWNYPIVPRSASGATSTWCPVTSTLPGNTSNTYYNWTWENNGTINSPSARTKIFLDENWMGYSNWSLAAGASGYNMNWNSGTTVTGGRHTIYYYLDELEDVWETSESDNWWGHQFVWSPYALSDDTPIWRYAPPKKDAWASPYWYNNDGFSFYVGQVHPDKWWSAVGILPYSSGADYDVTLWNIGDYTGSEGGFGGGSLKTSAYGGSASDFVIINDNMASAGTYYAGAINYNDGTGDFHIEGATSTKIYPGDNGPYNMTSSGVLDIYETNETTYNGLSAGDWGFKIEQTAGTCDLGISLYDYNTLYKSKGEYMTDGYANSYGDGGSEFMWVTIPVDGWYGLVVWKADSSDYSKTSTYKIKMGKCATPGTLANPSPADGATNVSVDADLDWDDCSDTEYYEVFLKEGSGLWVKQGETETSAWILGTLNEATHYDWYIKAWNFCGDSVYVSWDFTTEDNTAPTPDPMTWATEPDGASTSSIGMVATTATDDTPPLEYSFECITAQGNSSGWQTSTSYTDVGLLPNTRCGYCVMARDSAPTPNMTGYSGTSYAYTLANAPVAAGFSNITETSIQANWTANGNPAGTQYFCENTTAGTYSGWTTNTNWNSTGLDCGTIYSFRVKAKNVDGVETSLTDLGSQSTLECADTTPPTPDPMTWATEPYETGMSSILMVATTASDPTTPITYLFDFFNSPTGGSGGTDSAWQSVTSYTDSGLGINHQYGYRVKAKDGADNETLDSTPVSYDYTDIETPTGITFGVVTSTSIQAQSANTPSGLTLGSSGISIHNDTNTTSSGWKQDNTFWTSNLLDPNTAYQFRAIARNGDADATPGSPVFTRYTLANAPVAAGFSNITETSIQANWTANGNPAGTEYFCENTTAGTNSGWITGTYWNSTALDCGTSYSFRVKAKNVDGVETSLTDLGSQSTLECADTTPPTPDPMTWATEPYETGMSSILMVATTASDPTTPITYLFDFFNSPTGGSGGTDSAWQSVTSYTDSGLGINHQYGYRVRAKDGADNETLDFTPVSYDYTDIETPTGITFGIITSTSIQAQSANTPSGLTLGNSGISIHNDTNTTSSGWKQDNTFWTSSLLDPNTAYQFRAIARNGDADATPGSPVFTRYTIANAPGAAGFSNITQTSIQANWTANGNPAGTEYFCENTTAGTNSGWITGTYWNSTGLDCGTIYSFRVKAKNVDGVETTWTSLESQSTEPCADICECNLNGDHSCDMQDWLIFGEDWGRTDCGTPPGSGNPPNDCECDLNNDGRCDMLDWLLFGEDWGRTDCP